MSVKGAPLTCETSTPRTALHYTTTSPSSVSTTIPTPPVRPAGGAGSGRARTRAKRPGVMREREAEWSSGPESTSASDSLKQAREAEQHCNSPVFRVKQEMSRCEC
eukprot:192018-Rhodomonas_salina.1